MMQEYTRQEWKEYNPMTNVMVNLVCESPSLLMSLLVVALFDAEIVGIEIIEEATSVAQR